MGELTELREQLERLERRHQRLRAWCMGSTGLWVVACVAAVAAPTEREVRTQRLVLVDERGEERGRLVAEVEGATLTMTGSDSQAFLSAHGSGAALVVEGGDEAWSVVSLVANEQGAGLGGSFRDERDFDLVATSARAALMLSRGVDLADEGALPEAALEFDGEAGALVLRRGEDAVFRAPE